MCYRNVQMYCGFADMCLDVNVFVIFTYISNGQPEFEKYKIQLKLWFTTCVYTKYYWATIVKYSFITEWISINVLFFCLLKRLGFFVIFVICMHKVQSEYLQNCIYSCCVYAKNRSIMTIDRQKCTNILTWRNIFLFFC